jgi:hypothetical protein
MFEIIVVIFLLFILLAVFAGGVPKQTLVSKADSPSSKKVQFGSTNVQEFKKDEAPTNVQRYKR